MDGNLLEYQNCLKNTVRPNEEKITLALERLAAAISATFSAMRSFLSASFFFMVATAAALAALMSTFFTASNFLSARRFCSSASAFALTAAAAALFAFLTEAASFESLSAAALAAALAVLIL